jgi:hypothetical protein
MKLGPDGAPPSLRPIHLKIMPNSSQQCCEYSKNPPLCRIGILSAWGFAGRAFFEAREHRTVTMLDTALLIASALSVALMVAFSELP